MLFLCINEVLVVSDRGKGRKRQAILGEHPSSYNDKGYGKTHKQSGLADHSAGFRGLLRAHTGALEGSTFFFEIWSLGK